MVYPKINDDNDENQKSHLKEMYEAVYAALVKNNRYFNFKYWRYRDEERYYDELFKELERENEVMDYPKLDEKVFLIIAVIGSFYYRTMNPDIYLYRLLSVIGFTFMFYFFTRETFNMSTNGSSVTRTDTLYYFLNPLLLKSNTAKLDKYRRRLLSLDNRQCKSIFILLILEICFKIVIFCLGFALACMPTDEKIRTLIFDTFCYWCPEKKEFEVLVSDTPVFDRC
ncbi:unnamed protein product [Caenorhabditis brenneri]